MSSKDKIFLDKNKRKGIKRGHRIYCSKDCSNQAKVSRPTSIVVLRCKKCGKSFPRDAKEHKRSLKKGRPTFCSLECSSAATTDRLPRSFRPFNRGISTLDEFSGFRYFLKLARIRNKDVGRDYNISLLDLADLWKKQNGICAMTGVPICLPHSSQGFAKDQVPAYRASLDRINNLSGYNIGNVQFVSQMANFARNKYSISEFQEFITLCIKHRINKE